MNATWGARALGLCLVMLAAQTLYASPAFVIRFFGASTTTGCDTVGWADTLTFYNTTNSMLTVRIVAISNGTPNRTDPDVINVPPRTVVYPDQLLITAWIPNGDSLPKLWMMELDVPEGIVIESRNEVFLRNSCIQVFQLPDSQAKISLPVFRSAVPANQQQVHLGTDLGTKSAHINVGIYNQSNVVANAHIEVRRSCDNSLVDSRDVQVPANSLVQFTGFRNGANFLCSPVATTYHYMRYTLVTVDQPSMTFATVIGERLNLIPGIAPEVGLGMPANARY